jgi:hypothetical protein
MQAATAAQVMISANISSFIVSLNIPIYWTQIEFIGSSYLAQPDNKELHTMAIAAEFLSLVMVLISCPPL